MDWQRLRLALPLTALFVGFFLAPLCVLVVMSLSTDAGMSGFTAAHYVKFFTDRFNYSILFDTLLLGVKATLVCLAFGYPIAWISARAGAKLQSVLLFIVILPIMTSVIVRTFAWIVILGRQGILNQAAMGLGLTSEPLRLLFSEWGVVIVLAPSATRTSKRLAHCGNSPRTRPRARAGRCVHGHPCPGHAAGAGVWCRNHQLAQQGAPG